MLQHDVPLRAAARTIYETCLKNEGGDLPFNLAESLRTDRYRRAVEAAGEARDVLRQNHGHQLELL